MPSITSQKVDRSGGPLALQITEASGRQCTITKAEVQAIYQGTSGPAASRRAAVIQAIKDRIATDLIDIDPTYLDFDFDLASGGFVRFRVGKPDLPPASAP